MAGGGAPGAEPDAPSIPIGGWAVSGDCEILLVMAERSHASPDHRPQRPRAGARRTAPRARRGSGSPCRSSCVASWNGLRPSRPLPIGWKGSGSARKRLKAGFPHRSSSRPATGIGADHRPPTHLCWSQPWWMPDRRGVGLDPCWPAAPWPVRNSCSPKQQLVTNRVIQELSGAVIRALPRATGPASAREGEGRAPVPGPPAA